MWISVRSKDTQKQLARTFLNMEKNKDLKSTCKYWRPGGWNNSSNRTPHYPRVWWISVKTRCCYKHHHPEGWQNYFLLKKGAAWIRHDRIENFHLMCCNYFLDWFCKRKIEDKRGPLRLERSRKRDTLINGWLRSWKINVPKGSLRKQPSFFAPGPSGVWREGRLRFTAENSILMPHTWTL